MSKSKTGGAEAPPVLPSRTHSGLLFLLIQGRARFDFALALVKPTLAVETAPTRLLRCLSDSFRSWGNTGEIGAQTDWNGGSERPDFVPYNGSVERDAAYSRADREVHRSTSRYGAEVVSDRPI